MKGMSPGRTNRTMRNGPLSHRTPLPDEADEFASDGATVVDPRVMADAADEGFGEAPATRQGEVMPSEGPTRHADISALIARSPAARVPERFEASPTVAGQVVSNDVEVDVTVEEDGPAASRPVAPSLRDGVVVAPMAPAPTNRFRMDLVPPTWWEINGRLVVRTAAGVVLLAAAGLAFLLVRR